MNRSRGRADLTAESISGSERATRAGMLAAGIVALLHIVSTWGWIRGLWGDQTRWLYEVDRVAHGAVVYRDIFWSFPPMSMWIIGGIGRVIGSDLWQIRLITSGITLGIALTYGAAVARLVPRQTVPLVAATGMLLGVAFSQQDSAPLAMGMYTPAAPVAVLILLLQLLAFLRDWDSPSLARAGIVGIMGGIGILTKHDVWFACTALTLAAAFLTPSSDGRRVQRSVAAVGSMAATTGLAMALLAWRYGVEALPNIFSGFGMAARNVGVYLPNLSQATVELTVVGGVLVTGALVSAVTRVWTLRTSRGLAFGGMAILASTTAIWLWQARAAVAWMATNGRPQFPSSFEYEFLPLPQSDVEGTKRALVALFDRSFHHLIPLVIPATVLAIVLVRHRAFADRRAWRLLVILLICALSLRSRRMIAYTEWSSIMLEWPLYVVALYACVPRPERLMPALGVSSALLAATALTFNYREGTGYGSRKGRFAILETPRGNVRVEANLARTYRDLRATLDSADPSGTRPVFAFGYSGSLSYLLNRPSAGTLSQGFTKSIYATPEIAFRKALELKPSLLLVDIPFYQPGTPAPRFAPLRWDAAMQAQVYHVVDRPLFDELKRECQRIGLGAPSQNTMSVYDCSTATHLSP